ncbi:DUF3558 domain-containing protein [Rhodococcus sp. 06-156-3C]|nr:DUF3558 domain-containing protein [Rhodococcus sp. 06-156-4C]OZD14628.1 DUF3558 domain-containing protein [Rhodococcus sp. 06-156-4a]OZD24961.1 DUF3558 domain-containing protein [Rhodococcus sp. 06-156-3C]OZD27936.1 DUF3558 domain-containing protein [Rhodococcus sp. 06-156-3b]OZD39917.1 DUF3558 domain-containing protein [Rhodococcus sp. 06-156-3]OZF61068.1 DUF3558 domain-containing protein [Rhodococcus sp. 06-156-4]
MLGGCAREVSPQATAEPTRWDPCSITPEQIGATGLDPDFRKVGWGRDIVVPDWDICRFRPVGVDVPYYFVVKSSLNRTVEEARNDSGNLAGLDTELDGRDAYQFETDVARSIIDCNLAVDLPSGIVVFSVDYRHVGDGVDPCLILRRHVDDLKVALPSA